MGRTRAASRLLFRLALLGALGALASPTTADAASWPARVPDFFFGVNGQWVVNLTDDPTATPNRRAHLQAVENGSIRLMRADAPWQTAEPGGPTAVDPTHRYQWTAFDSIVTALAARGIRWLPILDTTPGWARPLTGLASQWSPPRDPADFGAYARAFAARYGPNGEFWTPARRESLGYLPVTHYEIWNEENLIDFWYPGPNPEVYADLLVAAADGIHAAQPEGKVMLGGLVPATATDIRAMEVRQYLTRVLARQPSLRQKIDVLGYHAYFNDPEDLLAELGRARQILIDLDIASLPIALTETGFSTHSEPNKGPPSLTQEERATEYHELIRLLARSNCNLDMVVPHTWFRELDQGDSKEDGFTLTRPDASLLPAGQAYIDEVRLFRGFAERPAPRSIVHHCAGTDDIDHDADGVPDRLDDYPHDPTQTTYPGGLPPQPEDQPPAAPTQYFASGVDEDFYGIRADGFPGLPTLGERAHFRAIAAEGIRTVRSLAYWPDVEPNAPSNNVRTFVWGAFDRWVVKLANSRLRWEPILWKAPSWLLPLHDLNSEYAAFIEAFARRYGENGSFWREYSGLPYLPVKRFQIWTEINANYVWQGATLTGNANPASYAGLYDTARSRLKGVAPSNVAVVGSLMPWGSIPQDRFLDDFYATGRAGRVDAVSISPRDVSVSAGIDIIRSTRQQVTRLDSSAVPLLAGDMGWTATSFSEDERSARYRQLGDWLAGSNCGMVHVSPYAWFTPRQNPNESWQWYGVTNSDATLLPPGQSYAAVIRQARGWDGANAPLPRSATC